MSTLFFNNNTMDLNQLWYASHVKLLKQITRELNVQDRQDELIDKFIGDRLKIKKRRDPNKPKRPLSSFLYFCNDYRDKVRSENPDLKMGGVMKELGKLWKNLDNENKDKFIKLAENAKSQYEDQLEQYNLVNS
jgi:hypothetical protein